MKPRTLVTQRLYFGVDAFRLREASGKVLSRVVGLSSERARVRADDIRRDFGLDTVEGAAMVEEMVAEGLLAPRAATSQLADRINNEWTRNPLEIAALAPFGNYLSQDPALESLPLGIVVRIRPATRRARWRMLTKADGAHEIRGAFKALSSFVRAQLCTELAELPPPFAVVYQAYEDDL